MDQDSFNLYNTIISVASLAVTTTGLFAVYIQLRKIQETTWSNTHSKLADQSFELLKFLSETPSTYDYFYNKKPLADDSPNRVVILYTAEALANFIEHIILQKENLPSKQWDVWKRFVYTTLKSSVVLRDFIQNNREWYSPDLLAIADECKLLY